VLALLLVQQHCSQHGTGCQRDLARGRDPLAVEADLVNETKLCQWPSTAVGRSKCKAHATAAAPFAHLSCLLERVTMCRLGPCSSHRLHAVRQCAAASAPGAWWRRLVPSVGHMHWLLKPMVRLRESDCALVFSVSQESHDVGWVGL
jgi:hypothetical protein